MGATGAHHGRTAGQGFVQRLSGVDRLLQFLRDEILREFTQQGERLLAAAIQTQLSYIGLDEAVQLFDDDELLNALGEVPDLVLGKGPDHAQF